MTDLAARVAHWRKVGRKPGPWQVNGASLDEVVAGKWDRSEGQDNGR